jgi:hypothetical protein
MPATSPREAVALLSAPHPRLASLPPDRASAALRLCQAQAWRTHDHGVCATYGSSPLTTCLRALRLQLFATARSGMDEVRGRLEVAVQHKGIEVRTVGPHDGP